MKKFLLLTVVGVALISAACSWNPKPKVSKVYPQKVQQKGEKQDHKDINKVQRDTKPMQSAKIASGDVNVGNGVTKTNDIGRSGTENNDRKSNIVDNSETKSNEVSNQPGYDNQIIGWGLKQNVQKPPEVPDSWIAMLKKYNGYYIGDTSKKEVYLTFDEGYEAGNTSKILDILKANDVKAAFFVTGHFVKTQPDLVVRMIREGHVVGNHTVNHPSMPTISNEKIKEELDGVQEAVYKLANYKMKYVRPPKGEFNERTLSYTKALGYKTVFWSLALADWQPLPGGPEESYNTVMKYLHPGAVILLHAVSKDDTEALDRILKDIKKQGYVFKSIEQLK